MKNFLILLISLIGIVSHAQDINERNKEIIRKLFEDAWNKKDFTILEACWSDSVIFHHQNWTGPVTKTDVINQILAFHESFPDFEFKIHQIISEGDFVSINVNFYGTHKKRNVFGIEPRNNPIDVSEMMFFKLNDYKVIEAWELYDIIGMKEQMSRE